jgi:hypothetical protein
LNPSKLATSAGLAGLGTDQFEHGCLHLGRLRLGTGARHEPAGPDGDLLQKDVEFHDGGDGCPHEVESLGVRRRGLEDAVESGPMEVNVKIQSRATVLVRALQKR